jgi:hypothetical protein
MFVKTFITNKSSFTHFNSTLQIQKSVKRCSIFTTEERGNTKIELLSPHCIITVPQWETPTPFGLISPSFYARWHDWAPPLLLRAVVLRVCPLLLCTMAPPLLLHTTMGWRDPRSSEPLLLRVMTQQGAASPSTRGGGLGHCPSICVRRWHELQLWQGSWPKKQDILL